MSRRPYIFIDESGNLDFGPNGTRHFALTCVSMERPFEIYRALDEYKYDCIENGLNIEYFHCYHDSRFVRRAVFDLISSNRNGVRVDSLVVEKSETAPNMRGDTRFYPEMLGRLLREAVSSELEIGGVDEIVVITDSIPINRKRGEVARATRTTLARTLPAGVKYRILHHRSRAHYGLQIADYCCWAIFRKWEMGDGAWSDRIAPLIGSETRIGASETES